MYRTATFQRGPFETPPYEDKVGIQCVHPYKRMIGWF